MRFIIFIVVVMLSGCGEPVPDYTKSYIAGEISDFHETQELFEQKNIAYRIARGHWKEKNRMHWQAVGDELTDDWQSKNCKPGFRSNEERRLLAEISSTRVSMNEYGSIASDYYSLFGLCGETSYLESYAEFKALGEFSSKTKSICGEVVHTYSGGVLGRKILSTYRELTSMNEAVANKLGSQAVKGYGDCMCVMHDYFKVKDNFSIGFCMGAEYFTCSHPQVGEAYCGQIRDRAKLAAIIGDYEYSVPRVATSYGSYASPGSTAADLLEWGKAQTESLVRDYCRGNPDC